MRKIFLLLIILCFYSNVVADEPFLPNTRASWDMVHIAGSTIGVLTLQKTFEMEWVNAAAIMSIAGLLWEVGDATIYYPALFDPRGFDVKDLYRNAFGVLISYPLKYDFNVGLQKDRVTFSYRW